MIVMAGKTKKKIKKKCESNFNRNIFMQSYTLIRYIRLPSTLDFSYIYMDVHISKYKNMHCKPSVFIFSILWY